MTFTGTTFTKSTNNLRIAVRANATEPFQGLLDDLTYWTTVPANWTDVEAIITQRYNAGAGRSY